jgi:hypothetical protein
MARSNEPVNLAIVGHAALNPLIGAKPATGFRSRRDKAGWNIYGQEKVIMGTA